MAKESRVGILGGGQLSLMLADAAHALGLIPLIYAMSDSEPACALYPHVLGSLGDERSLDAFFSQVDVVVFENEFVDCEKLRKVAHNHDVTFVPGLDAIALVQDKLQQKKLFCELAIPSPAYMELALGAHTEQSLKEALERFGTCVLKWSRMGYDGKGVTLLSDAKVDEALVFCAKAESLSSSVYAEEFVAFKRELAVVGVYSTTGVFLNYPIVISEQENSVCARVFGPAAHFGLDVCVDKEVRIYAEKLAKRLKLFGTFALEMFETRDGRILANEIAPRVHNSGHYTQDACEASQFENHWRAVLGMPLGSAQSKGIFAMVNFLGPDAEVVDARASARIVPEHGPQSRVHWYRKAELRPGRKMGHVNGVVAEVSALPELLSELEAVKTSWLLEIRK